MRWLFGPNKIPLLMAVFLLAFASISSATIIRQEGCIGDERAYGTLKICPENLTAFRSGYYSGNLKSNFSLNAYLNISFEFPQQLIDGRMEAWSLYSHPMLVPTYENRSFTQNFSGISNIVPLTAPPPNCDIGAMHPLNPYFYNLTWNNTAGKYACISGATDLGNGVYAVTWWNQLLNGSHWEDRTYWDWQDVSNLSAYLERQLPNGSTQFEYIFNNVFMPAYSNLSFRFWFDVGYNEDVKFNVLGYQGDHYNGVGNNTLFEIDPSFDSSGWKYYWVIENTEIAKSIDGTQFVLLLNGTSFNYSHAQADGCDLRIAHADALNALTEYGVFIENWSGVAGNGTSAIHFNTTNATGQTRLYYGNPSASCVSDIKKVYPLADDFPRYANGTHAINSSIWMTAGSWTNNTLDGASYINISNWSGGAGYFNLISLLEFNGANKTELLFKASSDVPVASNNDFIFGWTRDFTGGSPSNATFCVHQPGNTICQLWFSGAQQGTGATDGIGIPWETKRLQWKSNNSALYSEDYSHKISDIYYTTAGAGHLGTFPILIGLQDTEKNNYLALDWVAVRNVDLNLAQPLILLLTGSEFEINASAQILSPATGTTSNSTSILFNATCFGSFPSYTANYTLDGATNSTNLTMLNGTNYSTTWTLPTGAHTLSWTCSNSTITATDISLFSMVSFTINETFEASGLETNLTLLNATLTSVIGGVVNISAQIWFNGTLHSADKLGNLSWSANLRFPVILTNNSNLHHTWQFQLNYSNGTSALTNASEQLQAIYFAYLLSNVSFNETTLLEGDYLRANISFITFLQYARLNSSIVIGNQKAYSGNSSYAFHTNIQASPGGYITVGAYANITISDGTFTRNLSSSNTTISFVTLNATNCSTGGSPVLLYLLYDEETKQPLTGSIELTLTLYNSMRTASRNVTLTNYTAFSLSVCLTNTSVVYADSVMAYWNESNTTNYLKRYHYLLNATLNPSAGSQDVPLYALNETLAAQVVFTIISSTGTTLPNSYVVAERFYPGENLYRAVAMLRTGEQGVGNMPLKHLDTLYRFRVYRDFALQKTTDTTTISCLIASTCAVTIRVGAAELIEYLTWSREVGHSCLYDNSSHVLNCSVAVTTQIPKTFRLVVEEASAIRNTPVCDTSLTTAGGSISCSGLTAPHYTYVLTFSGSPPNFLESGSISTLLPPDLGGMGRLLGLFLFLAISFIGIVLADAFIGAMFVTLGFIILVLAGLIILSELTVGGIIVVGVLIALKAASNR